MSLDISVSDISALTEDFNRFTDTATTHEVVSVNIPFNGLLKNSDSIVTSEQVSLLVYAGDINVSDSTSTSESVNVNTGDHLTISVNDFINYSEQVSKAYALLVSVKDSEPLVDVVTTQPTTALNIPPIVIKFIRPGSPIVATPSVAPPSPYVVYPGFGLNYYPFVTNPDGTNSSTPKSTDALQSDIKLFKSWGVQNIRISVGVLNYPHNTHDLATQRAAAKLFVDAGFYVTAGTSGVVGSPDTTAYNSVLSAEVALWISQGIIIGDFEIGNEIELFNPPSNWNARMLTITQAATVVKQQAPGIPISYAMSQTGAILDYFIDNGLGGLDYLSYHPYGSISGGVVTPGSGFERIVDGIAAFGNKFYVSEFNLDPSPSKMMTLTNQQQVDAMNNILQNYILPSQVSKFQVWTYNNYPGFNMLNADGTYNPYFWDFFPLGQPPS